MKPNSHKVRRRNGSVFILLLFLLPIIVLFVGFAIDVSYIQRVRAELRATTDLAAKAAAAVLSATQNQSDAIAAGILVASKNNVAADPLTLVAADFEFGSSTRLPDGSYNYVSGGSPMNSVRVTGARTTGSADGPVDAYFGGLYGHQQYQPQIDAYAAFIDVDICLVLDRSSSMKTPVSSLDSPASDYMDHPPVAGSRWIALDAAVTNFLNVMNVTAAAEKVAIATFATDYTDSHGSYSASSLDQILTSDMTACYVELNDRTTTIWNGGTDIEAGIVTGQNELNSSRARPFARKIMVVLTDGVYTEDDPTAAATAAAGDDIIIYTITFSDGADQTLMGNIATIGNGQHFHADTASDLDQVFNDIAASLAVLIN